MTNGTERYLADFSRRQSETGGDPSWLRRLRRAAIERFARAGFPTTKMEEWRFTDVRPIAETEFACADGHAARVTDADLELLGARIPGSLELVFVNGQAAPGLWRQPDDVPAAGVVVESLAVALSLQSDQLEPLLSRMPVEAEPAFAALNTAFLHDGAFVGIAAGTDVKPPIHLLFVSTGADRVVSHPRVVIAAGDNSRAAVIETYIGTSDARGFTNVVTDIVLGRGASVEHHKIQREAAEAFHVGAARVRVERDGRFASRAVSLGGALVRNEISAELAGGGADCTLDGLTLAAGRQLADSHTFIDHAVAHCTSHELYKSILAGRSRGVFSGRILVRQDAQKTDAKQTNRTLLLSDDAVIDTKPQLEIFADDVKCTHGAAVGRLDDEAVFYLRTRGIGEADARRLLTLAFAGEIIDRITYEPVRGLLGRLLADSPVFRTVGQEAA